MVVCMFKIQDSKLLTNRDSTPRDSYDYKRCDACPPGTYTEQAGMTTCLSCLEPDVNANIVFENGLRRGASSFFECKQSSTCYPGFERKGLTGSHTIEVFGHNGFSSTASNQDLWHYETYGVLECTPCTVGHFEENQICKPCLSNEYQLETGKTRCDACAPGKIVSRVTETPLQYDDPVCQYCTKVPEVTLDDGSTNFDPRGFFYTILDNSATWPQSGYEVHNTLDICKPCAPGRYHDGVFDPLQLFGGGLCKECNGNAGQYQDEIGQTRKMCPAGFNGFTDVSMTVPWPIPGTADQELTLIPDGPTYC